MCARMRHAGIEPTHTLALIQRADLALDVARLEARQHCLLHDRDALLSSRLDREAGRIKAAQLHGSYAPSTCAAFTSTPPYGHDLPIV